MSHTIETLAVRIARSFGKDTAAIAGRVRIMHAVRESGAGDVKSLTTLAAEATDTRIRDAFPGIDAADIAEHRTDPRFLVKSGTLGTYGLAARLVADMGLSVKSVPDEGLAALYATCSNRAGITDLRSAAVAAVQALPATERAGQVFPLFRDVMTAYRAGQRKPEPRGGVDRTEDVTPTADVQDVERRMSAADAAPVPASLEVILATIARLGADILALSPADAFTAADNLSDVNDAVQSALLTVVAA